VFKGLNRQLHNGVKPNVKHGFLLYRENLLLPYFVGAL